MCGATALASLRALLYHMPTTEDQGPVRRSYQLAVSAVSALALAAALAAPAAVQARQVKERPVEPSGANSLNSPIDYKLGVSDRIRIIVYNEPNLTGEYSVNAGGIVSFPLIGDVMALNMTTAQLAEAITSRLADGFLENPQVSIDVLTFRPFYILGEVNKPGEYPYSSGMTIFDAVATAQGFTYRANQRRLFIRHEGEAQEHEEALVSGLKIAPGDTIRIRERFF